VLQPIDEDIAASLGVPKRRGELVQSLPDAESPASRAGIKPGDIVTKVNGKDVTADQTVSYLVANLEPGTQVPVEVLREGKRLAVNVTLGKRPTEDELRQQAQTFDPDAEEPMAPGTSDQTIEQKLGMQVMPLSAAIARSIGVPADTQGVVIAAVDPNSDAARRGLRRGDIILSANYQPVASVEALLAQVQAATAENREAILLRIQRRTQPPAFIAVRLR
jgi:serine protease Do